MTSATEVIDLWIKWLKGQRYKTVYLQDQTSITRLKESAIAKNSF
jgi:hypothetical protein